MDREITNLRNQAIAEINESKSLPSIAQIRIKYIGKKGSLGLITKRIWAAPERERKRLGILINETKAVILTALAERRVEFEKPQNDTDLTLPGTKHEVGHKHLITQTIEEVENIFRQIGFVRRRYFEVEWDWYAFEALGFGPDHPARDEWETYTIKQNVHPKLGGMLLTPHTSGGQVREMERARPPIRMLNISKTYRRQSDSTHTPMFHQFEGLVIDKGINISHLRGTLEYFAKSFFGHERETRIRPYNFPFTEPSFEVDVNCKRCRGKGCSVCKGGWHEVAGAGMVHPVVLANGGVDAKVYSGFAFGMGIERIAMMRAELGDLRQIYSVDLRYLRQF